MNLTEYVVDDVISLVRRPVALQEDEQYQEIGLRSYGNGVFHKQPLSGQELGAKKVFWIEPGDLILSNIFAWEGAVAIASEAEAGMIGSHRFMTYRVNTQLADPRYLLRYFYGGSGLQIIQKASPGSAGRNRTLGIKSFGAQCIELPSLSEQRRVADKLDVTTGLLNSIQIQRSHLTGIRRELHESLISSALESGTSTVRMADVVTLARTEIDIDPEQSYRTIGMRSFGKGMIHYGPVPGAELSRLKYFAFPLGALTFNNIMAWEGAIDVTTEAQRDFIASQRFLFFAPTSDRVNVSYLRHFFLSRSGLPLISKCSPGAMARNRTLGIKKFEELKIPLPTRAAQDRAASAIDALSLRLAAAHAAPELAALRPALLNAAFSGQL